MGQAKRRGTYEGRKAAAIKRNGEMDEARKQQLRENPHLRPKPMSQSLRTTIAVAAALGVGL